MLASMKRVLTAMLFGVFVCVTLFGLPALLSHDDHHVGCPLLMAREVMCESTIFEHFSIWQAMLATIVVLVSVSIAVLFATGQLADALHQRFRLRRHEFQPPRPSLMQELYSSGILNRREPYPFS